MESLEDRCLLSVSGAVWNDADADGTWDSGELGLADWEVYVDTDQDGQWDSGEPITSTDSEGNYEFSDLDPGTYVVGELLPSGWEQTYPTRDEAESPAASAGTDSDADSASGFVFASDSEETSETLGGTRADAFLVPDEALSEMESLSTIKASATETESLGAPQASTETAVSGERPYGAEWYDGSEYMLGDVWVTVVLLESDGSIDTETEDWTTSEINDVKSEIQEGLQWWEDTLEATTGSSSADLLEFHIDYTYADSPVDTGYEPITHSYSYQSDWIDDFLDTVGYNTGSSYFTDLALWNDAQRLANGADWAYTVFVVDSSNDSDGRFADSYFAYAYIGGPFTVMTYDNDGWGINRMGQVLAHETGHIFYALDEYSGSNSYTAYSGYYNTQNLNAYDNNPDRSSRVASLMAESSLQSTAYADHTSSPTSLEMIGWKDSDGDGIFDVLDVDLSLTGSGSYDSETGLYRFSGTSSVQTLTNQNPRGRGNDITINTVDAIQYRLDGGDWITAGSYGGYNETIALSLSVSGYAQEIEIRTVCLATGVASAVFSDDFGVTVPGSQTVVATEGQTTTDVNFGVHQLDAIQPSILDVSVSDSLLTDADTGTTSFTVTVVFSETMDTSATPSVTFSPDLTERTAAILSYLKGYWRQTNVANDTYLLTCEVLDVDLEAAGVTIDVAAAKDAAGNGMEDYAPVSELGVDTLSPSLTNLSPENDATEVPVGTSLLLEFSEEVQLGSGSVVIKQSSDDSIVETIDVESDQVIFAGNQATVALASPLAGDTQYYVQLDTGAFEDLAGNGHAGIADTTTWTFATTTASVTLSGTDGNDTILVTLSDGASFHVVRIASTNGVETYTYDPAVVTEISIDGLEGTDTITIVGTDADEVVTMAVGSVDLESDAFAFHATNVETINVDAAGGADQVTMTGSADACRLYSYPDRVTFADSTRTFRFRAEGFEAVTVDAPGTDRDYAFLYDSDGVDSLDADPDSVVLTRGVDTADETVTTVSGFQSVYAYATLGDGDEATLSGSESGRDRFYGYADHSVLTESARSFQIYASGFDTVAAESTSTATTYAYLYDSSGNDQLTATTDSATFDRAESWSDTTVSGFERLYAYATRGGDDSADLTGNTEGGNRYRAYPTYATLTDATSSFYQYARGFDSTMVTGSQTDTSADRAYLYDSSGDDIFTATLLEDDEYQGAVLTDAAGTYENAIAYFDLVYARSSDSGVTDTVDADEELLAYDLLLSGSW